MNPCPMRQTVHKSSQVRPEVHIYGRIPQTLDRCGLEEGILREGWRGGEEWWGGRQTKRRRRRRSRKNNSIWLRLVGVFWTWTGTKQVIYMAMLFLQLVIFLVCGSFFLIFLLVVFLLICFLHFQLQIFLFFLCSSFLLTILSVPRPTQNSLDAKVLSSLPTSHWLHFSDVNLSCLSLRCWEHVTPTLSLLHVSIC